MMKVMALQVFRDIARNFQRAEFYSLMWDEATDVSNKCQLCLRWVDDELDAHDEFISLMDTSSTASIVRELKDVLLRMNLKLDKCCGQCYDGCSTMKGPKNGVAVQFKKEEKRAVYTHCYTHSLNLAVGDTKEQSGILKDTIDTTSELTKLVKKSPKRDAKLTSIKDAIVRKNADEEEEYEIDQFFKTPKLTLYCPT